MAHLWQLATLTPLTRWIGTTPCRPMDGRYQASLMPPLIWKGSGSNRL